jgi:hypothetical protein
VYAAQAWFNGAAISHDPQGTTCINRGFKQDELAVVFCAFCGGFSFWYQKQMIVPDGGTAPFPHPEMPEDVKADFTEARGIVVKSPKGAAALLRLAIQKLMVDLGESGTNLNGDIGNLVKKGLSPMVQQSLDAVRVIGNECVHPGVINLDDNPETAQALFGLVNIVVDERIAKPKAVAELYASLPKPKRDAIATRDKTP